MIDKLMLTGLLMFIAALILRNTSDDYAAFWWRLTVVGLGAVGFVTFTISALIIIWQ